MEQIKMTVEEFRRKEQSLRRFIEAPLDSILAYRFRKFSKSVADESVELRQAGKNLILQCGEGNRDPATGNLDVPPNKRAEFEDKLELLDEGELTFYFPEKIKLSVLRKVKQTVATPQQIKEVEIFGSLDWANLEFLILDDIKADPAEEKEKEEKS
jgi:hypothetical protein